jgi:hypothetical protein
MLPVTMAALDPEKGWDADSQLIVGVSQMHSVVETTSPVRLAYALRLAPRAERSYKMATHL